MPKFGKQKFPTLSAAAVDDEDDDELDIGDIDLEGEDSEGSEDDEELDDADEEEEEPDEDDDSSDEEEEDDEPSSRPNKRIRALAKQRKELEALTLKQQQELDKLRAAQHAQQHQPSEAEGELAFEAYLNSLRPEDRPRVILQRQVNKHGHEMAMLKFNMADQADKQVFDANLASHPQYKRLAAKVEEKLLDLRRNQNLNAPRMEILKHMLGEMVLKVKGKTTTKKKAEDSKKKHTVKPGNGRGDIGAAKRKGSTPRERLEGVKF